MDFLNNEATIDLNRYIKKYGCYYEFLKKIEDDIPIFNDDQIKFLKYLSKFIPLVRHYEYNIIKILLYGKKTYDQLLSQMNSIENFNENKFNHALNNLMNMYYSKKEQENMINYVKLIDNHYQIINVNLNEALIEHVNDLLDYGLTKFNVDFYGVTTDLKLYYTYTRSSLLQVLCNHTFASREGLIWNNGELYIFIDLKKDLSKEKHLLFDDKFISSKVLQWESSTKTTLDNSIGQKIINQRYVHVFVRKIKIEDGIVMPYIYIGKGELTNPRKSKNPKDSLLFDVVLENEVPDYLKYDFEIEDEDDYE